MTKTNETVNGARHFEAPCSAHDHARSSTAHGNGRVLVVDDDPATCELIAIGLTKHGFHVECRTDGTSALELIESGSVDVVVTDLLMDEMGGLELTERIVAANPALPVVLLTGFGTLGSAVGAIRAGAYDFIMKPIDSRLLALAVSRAVQNHRLRDELRLLRRSAEQARGFSALIGQSSAMQAIFALVERVAQTDASVLIGGESGTGKDLVARAVHERSARRDGPFVALNCAAMPASLIESELFGHTMGAFTDAKQGRDGLFTQANGGTLFLDEIGEMPIALQPKLLRALQERTVRPVGGNREIPFDARVITASNRELMEAIREGRFREDLFYRINVVRVDVPPLRDRGGDILLLAQHFLQRFAIRFGKKVKGFAQPTAKALMGHDWPGNVRELENCIERAVALTRFDHLMPEDLPEVVRAEQFSEAMMDVDGSQELITVAELERRHTQQVLAKVGGNKARAARILGIHRRTLYRNLNLPMPRNGGDGVAG